MRYSRQTILAEIGEEGQKKLRSSSVLIVGLGGLGAPAATYLVGAGVGRVGLADNDVVSRPRKAFGNELRCGFRHISRRAYTA